ncbi:MAG: DNA polymerase III subunit delta' [Nonlabens sp.]
MRYTDILGLEYIKAHLKATVTNERIAHAQLFVGATGNGILPLALAYARNILCPSDLQGCHTQMVALAHPDVHFAFPVASTPTSGTKPTSDLFIKHWRSFLRTNPYGSLADWYQMAGIEKKNAEIRVVEAQAIMKKLSLKSYEGGFKILIVWAADRMNTEASNKLLKLIEEPPNKTVILLLAEKEELVLNTIKSRCQILHVPKLSTDNLASGLVDKFSITTSKAQSIARQADGDFNKAIQFYENRNEDLQFENWVVNWVRTAFQAKKKPAAIAELLDWSHQIAGLNRETQKRFLNYCLEFFRQAMLLNYKAGAAVYFESASGFDLKKLAPFITGSRMLNIQRELQDAIFHIDRNANGKVVLSDMAISLTRIIHS